jgi:dTDP-4-dehydrorhamnose 3,5-epimerase
MKELRLNQPFKFRTKKFIDKRGFLSEIFSKKNINLNFNHSIISISKKNVIRGLHFRTKPEFKILYILRGMITDYCINLKNKKKFKFRLKEHDCLLIPPGFAHGYECYNKENIVIYFLSWPYDKKLQSGIYYKDIDLNIRWKIKKPIISKKDLSLSSYKNISKKKYY